MKFSQENLPAIRKELTRDFNISETGDADALLHELAAHLNHLLQSDFSKLLNLLYRIDIPENTVAAALHEQPNTDAGIVLAQLIVERQIKKLQMRRQFNAPPNIPDDEKW